MTQPTFKQHEPIIYLENNSNRRYNFEGNGIKGISNIKGQQGQSKDAKAEIKRYTKSTTFDRGLKRKRRTSDRNC
jgi:hypothetical protein